MPSLEFKYSFRKSILENEKTFSLLSSELLIEDQSSSFRIPYSDIKSIRLKYDPTRFNTSRFICNLASLSGNIHLSNSHFVSFGNFENRDQSYRDFVVALCQKACEAGHSQFLKGPPKGVYFFYIALVFFSFLLLHWALTTFSSSFSENHSLRLIVFAFYAYFSFLYFKRNRPGRFAPNSIDSDLLP